MVMKIISYMVLIIIISFIIWLLKKELSWYANDLLLPIALKLFFNGLIIYVLNATVLFVVLTIIQDIVQGLKNPDAALLIVLSFVIPIYTALFIIINLFIFQGLSKKADTFLKKLQAIFETVLILLTISMLLATIAGVISKSLQMTLLTNILLFYMPFVPIMGSLKIKFSN